jgi:hypothetical protein
MSFPDLKPSGIADLTAYTASDDLPHRWLYRKAIFLIASASPIIAQLGQNFLGFGWASIDGRGFVYLV